MAVVCALEMVITNIKANIEDTNFFILFIICYLFFNFAAKATKTSSLVLITHSLKLGVKKALQQKELLIP
jgi:small basic protein